MLSPCALRTQKALRRPALERVMHALCEHTEIQQSKKCGKKNMLDNLNTSTVFPRKNEALRVREAEEDGQGASPS